MKLKRIKNIILFASLAMGGIIAFASVKKTTSRLIKRVTVSKVIKTGQVDAPTLSLLLELAEKINPSTVNYQLSGEVSYSEGKEGTANESMPCISIRRGDDFYYRLGQTETIQQKGLNVCVDHNLKKIAIYKAIAPGFGVFPIKTDSLAQYLSTEGYRVKLEELSNTESRIVVSNPDHVRCKEFYIRFLNNKHLPLLFFSRLSNPADPDNMLLDKRISFRMDYSGKLPDSLLMVSKIIRKEGKETFSLMPAYTGYELMDLR
ncbi:hypothetical protein [Pedobacter frigidisoli]|uniref:hypothetical protein n=1 Tax=Pedobacter frigidisoli TaxID=2530455 RepID=UPI00292E483C|nr:hypothetical protein [Pedobacter frigidisoli]